MPPCGGPPGPGARRLRRQHPLDAHQKAADYTVARVRGMVDLFISAGLLLA
jgi:hypothetical protein